MATLTIRNLDDKVKDRLRVRAARNGRSMEEEARSLLGLAVELPEKEATGLAAAIRRRFASAGDFTLETAPRQRVRPPPKFG